MCFNKLQAYSTGLLQLWHCLVLSLCVCVKLSQSEVYTLCFQPAVPFSQTRRLNGKYVHLLTTVLSGFGVELSTVLSYTPTVHSALREDSFSLERACPVTVPAVLVLCECHYVSISRTAWWDNFDILSLVLCWIKPVLSHKCDFYKCGGCGAMHNWDG